MFNIGRARHPGVSASLVNRMAWLRKIAIGESANRDGNEARRSAQFPIDRRSAGRAEVEADGVAAIGEPGELRCLARDCDLFAAEARLYAEDTPRALLESEAMTH